MCLRLPAVCLYFILGFQPWLRLFFFFLAFLGVAALGALRKGWHRVVILGHRIFNSKILYQGDRSPKFVYNDLKVSGIFPRRFLNWAQVIGPFFTIHSSSILGLFLDRGLTLDRNVSKTAARRQCWSISLMEVGSLLLYQFNLILGVFSHLILDVIHKSLGVRDSSKGPLLYKRFLHQRGCQLSAVWGGSCNKSLDNLAWKITLEAPLAPELGLPIEFLGAI